VDANKTGGVLSYLEAPLDCILQTGHGLFKRLLFVFPVGYLEVLNDAFVLTIRDCADASYYSDRECRLVRLNALRNANIVRFAVGLFLVLVVPVERALIARV
jgi:hypothetical protein